MQGNRYYFSSEGKEEETWSLPPRGSETGATAGTVVGARG